MAEDAAAILLRNVYGWFEWQARGMYGLTPAGETALVRWAPPGPAAGTDSPPQAEAAHGSANQAGRAVTPR